MSNTLCNPFLAHALTIEAMHETMKRLYKAAADLRGWEGQSEVARHLNASPQTLNNWESRGMSKGGMLTAQERIGCSAVWLETGRGKMRISDADALAHDDKTWQQIVWLWNNADKEVMTMLRMMVNAMYIKKHDEKLAHGLQADKPSTLQTTEGKHGIDRRGKRAS